MTEWERSNILISEGHATVSGHFPGRPVIPGALLLDEAAQAIAGGARLSFRAVKFLAPARHGERLELRWRPQGAGLIRFEIRRPETGEAMVTGTLEPEA